MHAQSTAIEPSCSTETAPDLHVALVSGLRTPLAALRATLETLAHRFEDRDPRAQQTTTALAHVIRLQHNVQTLVDAERPSSPRMLSCTLHEIVASAVAALAPEHNTRVLVAVECGDERVLVDGPLVSRALTRLVECGLDQSSAESALVRVSATGGRATFSVLHARFELLDASIDALVLHVARRDVQRMGGTFVAREERGGVHAFDLEFALAAAGEEAA